METAYKYVLALHVACGFVALLTGLVAIFAKKGKPLHNRVGVIYFWGMFGVFVTTLVLFSLKPTRPVLQFFLMVAVASFYQTFTGRRTLGRKKAGSQPTWPDWLALGIVIAFGLGTLGFSGYTALQGNWFMGTLYTGFTWICLSSGWQDWRLYTGRTKPEKGGWLILHIMRMMSSYAATVTAFMVNMSGRLPETTPKWVYLTAWILPGLLIGGIGIRRYVRIWRAKLNPVPKTVVVA